MVSTTALEKGKGMLIIGDQDFSFACSLAYKPKGATRIVVTCYNNPCILSIFSFIRIEPEVSLEATSLSLRGRGVYRRPLVEERVIKSGIIRPSTNHAMLITDYGFNEFGEKVYYGQNSWDKTWGKKGFMHIARDVNSPNNLAFKVTVPIKAGITILCVGRTVLALHYQDANVHCANHNSISGRA